MSRRSRCRPRPKSTPCSRSPPAACHRLKKNLSPRPPNNRSRETKLSQAEDPERLLRVAGSNEVSVEDVRRLMGASTPHFALQLRNRIAKLIAGLPADHPARLEGEREITRLEELGLRGETRGEMGDPGERPLPPLPSLDPS